MFLRKREKIGILSSLYTDVSQKRGKIGLLFCTGGCVAPPEKLGGLRPPTLSPPVSAPVAYTYNLHLVQDMNRLSRCKGGCV